MAYRVEIGPKADVQLSELDPAIGSAVERKIMFESLGYQIGTLKTGRSQHRSSGRSISRQQRYSHSLIDCRVSSVPAPSWTWITWRRSVTRELT